uniref:Coiled-coil-helix-coiled-coil-helix domain containing 4b n=1 Tax=Eptatretus burgeri TaxID=7764 RepID=A0A8C4RC32_EPTBU
MFVTRDDHASPSLAEIKPDDPDDPYEEHGLILPNGEINWNCPCLGGMASGPCSDPFKAAFSCFHKSQEDMRGSDCLNQFRDMQECMQRYPELYPQDDEPQEDSEKAPQHSHPCDAPALKVVPCNSNVLIAKQVNLL